MRESFDKIGWQVSGLYQSKLILTVARQPVNLTRFPFNHSRKFENEPITIYVKELIKSNIGVDWESCIWKF